MFNRGSQPQTGYILGFPVESPAISERSLNPVACTIIKVLMHSVLLWTCCTKEVKNNVFIDLKVLKYSGFNQRCLYHCKNISGGAITNILLETSYDGLKEFASSFIHGIG